MGGEEWPEFVSTFMVANDGYGGAKRGFDDVLMGYSAESALAWRLVGTEQEKEGYKKGRIVCNESALSSWSCSLGGPVQAVKAVG